MEIQTEASVQTGTLPLSIRFGLAAWILLGQLVSVVCLTWLSFILGSLSRAFPFLGSPLAATVLLPVLGIGAPVLCSWAFARQYMAHVRPLVVAVVSYVFAASPFVLTVLITGDSHVAPLAIAVAPGERPRFILRKFHTPKNEQKSRIACALS